MRRFLLILPSQRSRLVATQTATGQPPIVVKAEMPPTKPSPPPPIPWTQLENFCARYYYSSHGIGAILDDSKTSTAP
jgi:hypothetical protein